MPIDEEAVNATINVIDEHLIKCLTALHSIRFILNTRGILSDEVLIPALLHYQGVIETNAQEIVTEIQTR